MKNYALHSPLINAIFQCHGLYYTVPDTQTAIGNHGYHVWLSVSVYIWINSKSVVSIGVQSTGCAKKRCHMKGKIITKKNLIIFSNKLYLIC